jgi:hypothetical protein
MFDSVMLRRSVFDFAQFALPNNSRAIIVPAGTDVYELTPRQIRKMYETMLVAQVEDDEPIPVDVSREGEEECPMCRGRGAITVVHPASDAPATEGG